jgi:hypothetical protein
VQETIIEAEEAESEAVKEIMAIPFEEESLSVEASVRLNPFVCIVVEICYK